MIEQRVSALHRDFPGGLFQAIAFSKSDSMLSFGCAWHLQRVEDINSRRPVRKADLCGRAAGARCVGASGDSISALDRLADGLAGRPAI